MSDLVAKPLTAAILDLHEDIRSVMVVSLKDNRLVGYESRARFNVPPHVRERAGNVWALLIHAIGEQLAEYFQATQFVLFEHARVRFIALQSGDRFVILSMRRRVNLSEVPELVAKVKALPR